MPKVSKDSAANVERHGPVDDRNEDLDGYTVNFVTFDADVDGTPLLKGMPDDNCTCPHWGYVLKGRVTYRYADHDEVFEVAMRSTCPPGISRSSTPAANSCSSAPPSNCGRSPSR